MSKRIFRIAPALALLALALPVPAVADEDPVTVQGEVLDMACYIGHGARGEEHAPCAAKCVKAGQPMGLLTDDGKVYLLVANHKDASPFERTKELAGKKVEISGPAMSRDGVHAIEVLSVKAI